MAYQKTVWNNLAVPAINAANLNKIEQGIADAHSLAASGGASRPSSPVLYQCYFDITINKPIWWNGSNWVDALGETV